VIIEVNSQTISGSAGRFQGFVSASLGQGFAAGTATQAPVDRPDQEAARDSAGLPKLVAKTSNIRGRLDPRVRGDVTLWRVTCTGSPYREETANPVVLPDSARVSRIYPLKWGGRCRGWAKDIAMHRWLPATHSPGCLFRVGRSHCQGERKSSWH